MPVIKKPVIHKFGIISYYQRLKLQTQLYRNFTLENTSSSDSISKRNPFQVTEEFVEKYNSALGSDNTSKENIKQLKDMANKMFLKIKRRLGLQFNCDKEAHIKLALGWTELTILSQCNCDLSNKCLDLLCLSLSVAPITKNTFFVQFYLLETALYFLQTAKCHSKHPIKHIKWLQIGELAALRIYIQSRLRFCQSQKDNLNNLKMYMKDLDRIQQNFANYPETAVSFCVINELCEYLSTQLTALESGEVLRQTSEDEISPLLWNCVDFWYCSNHSSLKQQLPDSVANIQYCLMHNPSFGNWMDCYLSFHVFASVSCSEIIGLDVFQSVIMGLCQLNSEMEKKVSDKFDGSVNLDHTIKNGKFCGFEKGTVLMFAALREFSKIPLWARKSEIRERCLSTLAEWLLHESDAMKLSEDGAKILISRLKASLEIIDFFNQNQQTFSVMKNAVWSLLETLNRKHLFVDSMTFGDCLQYGTIISRTTASTELPQNASFIHDRVSMIFSYHFFTTTNVPIPSEYSSIKNTPTESNLTKPNTELISGSTISKRQHVSYTSKKTVFHTKKPCEYIRQSDRRLNEILYKLWESEVVNSENLQDECIPDMNSTK